jgi:hypothetical protein
MDENTEKDNTNLLMAASTRAILKMMNFMAREL